MKSALREEGPGKFCRAGQIRVSTGRDRGFLRQSGYNLFFSCASITLLGCQPEKGEVSSLSEFGDHSDFVDHELISRLSRLPVLPYGLVEGSFSGMHRSPHHGSSVEFAEYRKYVPGDDIRFIDWRVYAKTDRYYLKEFEADTNMRLFLVLDASKSMGFIADRGTKFAYARKLAATLAYMAVHQGDHVGLQVFNEDVTVDIPARSSPAHLKAIFDTLAAVKPRGKTDVVTVLHNLAEKFKRRAMVVVMSDFFTELPPLMDCFHHMQFRNHDLSVFHLLDPKEVDFDFDRPIRFVDMESSYSMVTEPNTVKDDYLNALHVYMANMKRGCDEHGADYQMINMEKDHEEVLSSFLLERMRK